jgi:hypothetical protein
MEPSFRMSRVRFHAGDIDLELSGSGPFVLRQLKLLSTLLGRVDSGALGEAGAAVAPAAEPEARASPPEPAGPVTPRPPEPAAVSEPEPAAIAEPEPAAAEAVPEPASALPRPVNGGPEAPDDLLRFYRGFRPNDLDRQSDAALLFAYWLQQREGFSPVVIGDLIRCCIRAGVDTRNFNRTIGTLTRRGFLETTSRGYRLSDQGVAAVESRM